MIAIGIREENELATSGGTCSGNLIVISFSIKIL